MIWPHYNSRVCLGVMCRTLLLVGMALGSFGGCLHSALAQQTSQSKPALVFDGVTVIDVEHGTRLPAQRVVVTGTRITAVGPLEKVAVPVGAQIVDARGKYMIPGLWDMHIHSGVDIYHPRQWGHVFYPLFLANGVTGARDAGAAIPLDTLRMWRREILDGSHPGPVRLLFSGQAISEVPFLQQWGKTQNAVCYRSQWTESHMTCIGDEADARHLVDSLKAAGADIIKLYGINTKSAYYAIASETRRVGLPFGGHLAAMSAVEASDSGVTLIDHINSSGGLDTNCVYISWWTTTASVARCQPIAARLAHNNTWFVPTVTIVVTAAFWAGGKAGERTAAIMKRTDEYLTMFWSDSAPVNTGSANWLHGPVNSDTLHLPAPDSIGWLRIAQQVGLPIVAGVDADGQQLQSLALGFGLHEELAALVAEGLTPLTALQAATLNPAKALRMTDSLGTVAVGKLADLVILDADPLVDITNTTTIQAVVANGRYYDRAALDRVLQDVRAMVQKLLYDQKSLHEANP